MDAGNVLPNADQASPILTAIAIAAKLPAAANFAHMAQGERRRPIAPRKATTSWPTDPG